MNRREFLGVAPLAAGAGTAEGAAGSRPNIVVVMADQLRAGITRMHDYPLDTMPALDRLAARGVSFDCAYTSCPVCAPARTSMLTGRWPSVHRVRQNSAADAAYFERDLFDVLKPLGYRTGLAGKNHSYLQPQKLAFWREYSHGGGWKPPGAPPEAAAFDRWLTLLNHAVAKEPTPFPAEVQLPHRIISDAIDFIGDGSKGPFALWISFPEPHNPYQVPKPYFDMFPPESVPPRRVGPEVLPRKGFKWELLRRLEDSVYPGYDEYWRRTKSNYLGMVRLIDDQLARLVRHLEARGLMESTIMLFVSDHGDFMTDYGLMRKGVELPECLVRIPMVWSGWGVRGGRQHHPAHVSLADVMPTLCEAAGAAIPRGVQGRSLWPLLQGGAYPQDEFRSVYAEVGFGGLHYDVSDEIDFETAKIRVPGAVTSFDELNSYTQSGYLRMVRMGAWKLIYDMMGRGQLYNLDADPYELNNLYGKPEAAAEQMRLLEELLAWSVRLEDNIPQAAYKPKWAPRNWYAPYRSRRG